jgi:uncharacterized protein YbjT (DUF2867 family)
VITIIGASGAVGVPTIRHLARRGARVRALTSNEASAARLRALGVAEAMVGDFRSDADVARAVAGAEAVLHVPPRFTEDEAAIGLRVVAAARRAGVERLVFSSAFHPQMRKMDHHWSKLLVEEAVIESGLPFTIVQPAMFMQNVRIEWREVVEKGVYPRPYSPDRPMSVIDTEDLGEALAKILTEPDYDGATFELASGDRPTHAEMAAHLAEALGRPVIARKRDLEDWKAWAGERGWKPWSIAAYAKMCEHYDRHGYPGGNALVLRTILGRTPTDYRAFARRFVAEMGKGG